MTKVAANSSLTIKKEYEFVLDYANLNNIYGSIIGNDAINTYCLLVNEALNSNRLEKKQDLFKFLNRLGWQHTEFSHFRSLLEAIGLISTFYEENEETYYILIKQPRTLRELLLDLKIKQLYIKHLGEDGLERLCYLYTDAGLIKTSALNISATIDILFDNDNEIPRIDYSAIYQRAAAQYKNPINISFGCKNVIETQCLCFSTEEIINLIMRSTLVNEKDMPVVDLALLNQNVDQLNSTSIKYNPEIKIVRNHKIFIKKATKEEIELVFKSYKINSEQYLFSITKVGLTPIQVNLIKNLRTKYMTDEQINMLIDLSYVKTKKFNPQYIKKTATTVLENGFDTCDKMLAYFDYSNFTEINNFYKEKNDEAVHAANDNKSLTSWDD